MKFTLFDRNIAGRGVPLGTVFIGLWAVFSLEAIATPMEFKKTTFRSGDVSYGRTGSEPVLPYETSPKHFFENFISAGIWRGDEARYQLSEEKATQLTNSLRRITGFESLGFAADGQLSPGDPCITSGGSARAREVLRWSLASGHRFILEDHSGSPTVNFGQLDQGTNYEDARTGLRLTIWRVRLDFDDFQEMQASHEIRDAFDVGFTTLHELLHGLGHEDAAHPEGIGEVEQLLNQARAELGLLQRDRYFGEHLRCMRDRVLVRLRFRDETNRSMRGRFRYLFFIAHSPSGVGVE